MYEITVVNKHHETKGEYIGRGSPLGNPFPMNSSNSREQVIINYKEYIISQINHGNTKIINELKRLHTLAQNQPVNLVCFCAPKACHGDIIKQILIGTL